MEQQIVNPDIETFYKQFYLLRPYVAENHISYKVRYRLEATVEDARKIISDQNLSLRVRFDKINGNLFIMVK